MFRVLQENYSSLKASNQLDLKICKSRNDLKKREKAQTIQNHYDLSFFSGWHIFLLPISGYICYGGWKEPLVESYSSKRSQNTFSSKVQALQSLSSTAKDGGHGHSGTEVGGHYVVISAAETPHKRFCVRLIMDHDNSNVSLWANSQDCPRDRDEGQLWSFNLTRTSTVIFLL